MGSVAVIYSDLSNWLIVTAMKVSRGFESQAESFSEKLWGPWTLWFECGFELKGSRINIRRE